MTASKPTGFRRKAIDILINDSLAGSSPRRVQAHTIGEWAVHRYVIGRPFTDQNGVHHDGLGSQWAVTHLPTGRLCHAFDRLDQAKRFVIELPSLNLPFLGDAFDRDASTRWSIRTRERYRKAILRLADRIMANA